MTEHVDRLTRTFDIACRRHGTLRAGVVAVVRELRHGMLDSDGLLKVWADKFFAEILSEDTNTPRFAEPKKLRADLQRLELAAWHLENQWAGKVSEMRERAQAAEAEVKKLQAFKAYVHNRLDSEGVPSHPEGTHSAEGCRVGDRLDIVFGKVQWPEIKLNLEETGWLCHMLLRDIVASPNHPITDRKCGLYRKLTAANDKLMGKL